MKICDNCGEKCKDSCTVCPACEAELTKNAVEDKPYSDTFNKYNTKHFEKLDPDGEQVEKQPGFIKKHFKLIVVLAVITVALIFIISAIASYEPDLGLLNARKSYAVFTEDGNTAEGGAVLQGLANENGEIILKAEYQKIISEIDDGVFAVIGDNSKIGAVNKNGKEVIPFNFIDCDEYGLRDGLWAVSDGDKWGYVNKKGDFKISAVYDDAGAFSDGLAAVCLNGKWGYIDKNGNTVIECKYDAAEFFDDGLARVSAEGLFGFINKKGEIAVEIVYDYADQFFSEGLCAIRYGNRYGYINKKGEWVINPQFDYAFPFSDGLAAVSLEGAVGYVNKKGEYEIKPQYKNIDGEYVFYNGLAAVTTDDSVHIINKDGQMLSDKYAGYTYADARFDGFILVRNGDGKYGLLKTDCSGYIYDPTYTNYVGGYVDTVVFYDEVQEKYIYINAKGEVLASLEKNVMTPAIPSFAMDIKDVITTALFN